MIQRFFHRWEQRLADVSRTQRVVRPFEWGLDWVPPNGHPLDGEPVDQMRLWIDEVMKDTDGFFTPSPTSDYVFSPAADAMAAPGEAGTLTFPSALETPHPENNIVRARFFPARTRTGRRKRAVVVLPQWNSDAGGHVGLSQLLAQMWDIGAAHQLAVPRSSYAAGALACRLHRELEHRAHRASVPSGGARRSARAVVAPRSKATTVSGCSARASGRVSR